MAKKSMCRRNEKKLALVQKYFERRSELKSKIKSAKSFDEVREAQEALLKLPLNASPVRYNRRCNQCGRPHAVYRKFGLCRICLRQQLMTGNVTGGRKSSW